MRFIKSAFSNPKSLRLIKIYGVIYFCLILVLASFILGWELGSKKAATSGQESGKIVSERAQESVYKNDVNFNLYWNVLESIKNKYVSQPVEEVKLFYGSLLGMVAALGDPYSVFLEPKIAEEFTEELAGEFSGIGAEVGMKGEHLIIIAPLEGSPAERAGLRPGDKVVSVNDESIIGLPIDVAVSKIRGPKGTEVKLTILRNGLESAKEIKITRDKIVIRTVRLNFLENDTIAHLRVTQFNEDTLGDFNRAVTKILNKGSKKLILDLRNNPGGLLTSAVDVAGEWIKNDVVVIERFASGDERVYRSNAKGRLQEFKTAVLVNNGSASGSEIIAGALQDYNLGKLIGLQTFGKGSVQDLTTFSDGSALKLTIAEWLTPKKRSINNVGIEPDIKIDGGEDTLNLENDPQLEAAVKWLKGELKETEPNKEIDTD